MNSESLIEFAIAEAKKGYAIGEVPIGAVVANDQEIISKAYNLVETQKNPTAHAEILAIHTATSKLGRWRLDDCVIAVTLEPCPMCMAAIRLSRIKAVYYGATDSRYGFTRHAPSLESDNTLGPVASISSGIRHDECAALLQNFFKSRR